MKILFKKELAIIMKTQKFSIIVDEFTAINKKRCLGIVIRYYDKVAKKVISKLFSLAEIGEKSDAVTLYNIFIKELDLLNNSSITKNLIAFGISIKYISLIIKINFFIFIIL